MGKEKAGRKGGEKRGGFTSPSERPAIWEGGYLTRLFTLHQPLPLPSENAVAVVIVVVFISKPQRKVSHNS